MLIGRADPTAVHALAELFFETQMSFDLELFSEHPDEEEDLRDVLDNRVMSAENIVDMASSSLGLAIRSGLSLSSLGEATRDAAIAVGAARFALDADSDLGRIEDTVTTAWESATAVVQALQGALEDALSMHSDGEGESARRMRCLGGRLVAFREWSAHRIALERRLRSLVFRAAEAEEAYDSGVSMGNDDQIEALYTDIDMTQDSIDRADEIIDELSAPDVSIEELWLELVEREELSMNEQGDALNALAAARELCAGLQSSETP